MDIDYLKDCISYCEDTGIILWRERPDSHFSNKLACRSFNSRLAGKEAGGISSSGYRTIYINGNHYQGHRLAWFVSKGVWPNQIDHINGIRDDNRIINLRSVCQSENMRNQKLSNANSSGFIGVSWCNRSGKWRATIALDGRKKHLGYFDMIEDAINTRWIYERKCGYHENHGRA